MGVANYGQMTAGGWMYIGPQGIVHGTFNTILNAGRQVLGIPEEGNLAGKLFVSSGLGGMSGAQPKAADIAGAAVDLRRGGRSPASRPATTRAGSTSTPTISIEVLQWAQAAQEAGEPFAIAYHGNIVDLLEYCLAKDVHIDLLSDQTSCHNAYDGGYCPVGMTFEQRTEMLHHDRENFHKTGRRHAAPPL